MGLVSLGLSFLSTVPTLPLLGISLATIETGIDDWGKTKKKG